MPLASFFNVWHVLNGSTKVHEIFVDFLGCPCKNTSQIIAKIEDVISPCAFCNAVLHMQAYQAWGSPNIPAHKWGGGGGPPLGGINGIRKSNMLMQAENSIGSNTPGAASSAADLETQDPPKSKLKPDKIDVKKQYIFGIDFGRVRISFRNGFW